MWRFPFCLAALCAPLLADNFSTITVSSIVQDSSFFPSVPGCGGTVSGSTSAAIGFSCDAEFTSFGGRTEADPFSGEANAETDLGPYGIGASFGVQAEGCANFADDAEFGSNPCSHSIVSLTWSQDFTIEGAQGNGFVDVTLSGSFGSSAFGFNGLNFDLWNVGIPSPLFSQFQIPVTFGVPYTLTISGRAFCSAFDELDCQGLGAEVSDLEFTDALGNPLTGVTLVPVPDPSATVLIATVALIVVILRLAGRRPQRLRRRAMQL